MPDPLILWLSPLLRAELVSQICSSSLCATFGTTTAKIPSEWHHDSLLCRENKTRYYHCSFTRLESLTESS